MLSESIDLCFLGLRWVTRLLFCNSLLSFLFLWTCLREPSCSCGDLERPLTRFCGSAVAESSSAYCEDECGCARSRDLDLSSLLEPPLCSADGGGPADGDGGFISERSSSDTSSASGVTIG